jgi:ABC-type transport system substrate-binding protein
MTTRLLILVALCVLALGPGAVPAAGQDNVMVWGDGLPANLDPHDPYDVPAALIQLNVYDNLYRYQGNPPQLQPWLAESHSASKDGRTWEFKLKKGVKFHDGSELTADDVVWSIQRVLGLGKAAAGPLKAAKVESVSAVDKYTVRFVLEKPYAPFLSIIPVATIVNRRVVEPHVKANDWGNAWLAGNGAGSGAYVPDPASYIPTKALDLKRNPTHFMGWSHNAKPIDLIRVRPVVEQTTRVLALMKGEIDAGDSYLPTDQVERLSKVKDVVIHRNESMRIFIIRMNNTKPPFDNVDFRRCMSHAFNYDAFIGVILKNFAERNPAPIPKNLWSYPEGPRRVRQGQGQRRAGRPGDPAPHPDGAGPDDAGGAALPERRQEDRAQHEGGPQHVAQPHGVDGQAGHHARHVDPLGERLLHRSRELDRHHVRQRAARDVEGLVLVQEPERGRAAALGAEQPEPRGAGQALPAGGAPRGR